MHEVFQLHFEPWMMRRLEQPGGVPFPWLYIGYVQR